MRRSRSSTANDIVIDLTSLLDVIFIVLLVVMVNSKVSDIKSQENYDNMAAQLETDIEQAREERSSAENAEQIYNDMIENEKNLSKYILMVSVTAPYDSENPRKRTINMLAEGGEIESFELVGSDQAPFDEFKESLEKNIDTFSETRPEAVIILCLNDDNDSILYRDEKKITSILNEISDNEENVYLKGHLFEDE